MGMLSLTKGAPNLFTFVISQENGTPWTGLTGVTFYVLEQYEDEATGDKVGTEYPITETGTPGTYTGTFPFAAAEALNRNKVYRSILYKADTFRFSPKDDDGDDVLFDVE